MNKMKHINYLLVAILLVVFCMPSFSQKQEKKVKVSSVINKRNVSLDTKNPIFFDGTYITYENRTILLDEKNLFLCGSLSEKELTESRFVFKDFKTLAEYLKDGSVEKPMNVYIAPYVYWIDNPDDTEVKRGKDGREPFGIIIHCENLHLKALNPDARNTVLASQRGQAQGAVGNFTMFDFWGDGLYIENLTMGNFCNVDLEYPLQKDLGRKKRMTSITQAHVAYSHGDRIMARNVRFISRLNMNPLSGSKRTLFEGCHMEMTDDALNGTGVYLNCNFDFWGERPFWRSDMGGAIFLNCDFNVRHHSPRSFFCKSVGPVSVVDSRIHSEQKLYFGWTNTPTEWLRTYQANVKNNGQPYIIGADKPYNTVCMEQKNVLNAYRLIDEEGKTVYNTYNLLRGDDGWDPLGIRETIERISKRDNCDYTNIPTNLSIEPREATVQTGAKPIVLSATVKRHCNFSLSSVKVRWRVQQGYEKYVRLSTNEGRQCVVTPLLEKDSPEKFSIIAYTDDGLECATELTVLPTFLPAPKFLSRPKISIANGKAKVDYLLNLGERRDESIVTWYKSVDKDGSKKYAVAVSRMDVPELCYNLKKEDIGYYLMAEVSPKHLRSLPGEVANAVTLKPIGRKQVKESKIWETDFRNFPCNNQSDMAPGLWTIGGFKPLDTKEFDWEVEGMEKNFWVYGKAFNGAKGTGLYQNAKGARMLYTPLNGEYGDMEISLHVDPAKLAGQGFASPTGQYMDIYIKFDTKTLSGYALRIIRTTKYSNAVDFLLVKYDNGVVTPISSSVSSTCYRTNCFITLKASGDKLYAHAETTTAHPRHTEEDVVQTVDLSTSISPNNFGGYGIQHTGSAPGESITMLHKMRVEWK